MSEPTSEPKDFNPLDLPFATIDLLREIPKKQGIYFVISETEEILYVGKSTNLQQRLRGHHRLAQFKKLGTVKIAWVLLEDSSLLNRAEELLIRRYSPKHNFEFANVNLNDKAPNLKVIRNSILLEKSIDEKLEAYCRNEKIIKATWIEAVFVCLEKNADKYPELIQEIKHDARARVQERKNAARYRQAKTFSKKLEDS